MGKRFTVLLLASTAAIFVAAPASAQNSTPQPAPSQSENQIGDIIVTAQKRAENVQDVPIAISAFSAKSLENRAINNVAQLSSAIPNVSLNGGTPFSGSSAVLSAYIRGIGADDFAFNIDPGVGVYIDGVYLARSVGANQDMLDVERVEVLKGPQGTLFGRNTIGGAISIVTRDPGKTFRLVGDMTTGSYNLAQFRLSADIPITPSLSMLVSGSIKHRDGFLKRVPFDSTLANNTTPGSAFPAVGYSSSDHEGGNDEQAFRTKLRYDNSGALRATLGFDWAHSSDNGLANKLLEVVDVPGNFAGTTNLPGTAFDPTGTTGFTFAGLYNFCIRSTAAQIAARNAQALCGARGTQYDGNFQVAPLASVNVDGNPDNDVLPWDSRFINPNIDQSYATGSNFSRLMNWGVDLTLDYDLSNSLSIKSITAYRKLRWRAATDADGSPLNMAELSFPLNQQQFSQELQLVGSALDRKIKYVLGAYYFEENGSQRDYVTFADGLVQIDGPNTFKTTNYAAFGQIDIRPAEWIGFTLGGRYTREIKNFDGGQQDLNGFNYKLFGCADANGNIYPDEPFPLAPAVSCQTGIGYPNPNNPVQLYPPGENRLTFTNFSPKLGVQFHPSKDVMVYGSWSKGYRTGGWTTRLTNPQADAPSFDPEIAETFEAGIKSDLLDRHLQLNLAAFTTSYSGIQLNFQVGTSPTLQNAGNARIKGIELESVLAPVNGLTVHASAGYLDAYYTYVAPGVLNVSGPNAFQLGTVVGAALPKSPKWKINVSPQYVFYLANGGSLTLVGDWTHTSSSWNDAQRSLPLLSAASDVINASLTYELPNGKWSITAGGTNLTDDRFLTTGNSNIADGLFFGSYNRPREWYVRAGFKF